MKKKPTILCFIGLLLGFTSIVCAQSENPTEEQPYYTAEKMPEYPGGMEALYKFMRNNLIYPDTTTEAAKEGRVILRFFINTNGEVKDITVLKGLNKECDEEAVRVMKLVPKWMPGQQEGKNVAIYSTLPISFKRLNPVLMVDGVVKPYALLKDSLLKKQEDMASMTILKEETAKTIYGELGKTGIILVVMKPKPIIDNVTHKELKPGEIAYGVEVMPQFPGGDDALLQFIRDNLRYPEKAAEVGIDGRVTMRFTILATGELTDIKVVRGLDPLLDAEAVRVIKIMPNWIPGRQNGKNVPVYITLPIVYKLQF